MSRSLRVLRKLLTWRTLLYGSLFLMGVLVGGSVFLQTPWGNRVLGKTVETLVENTIPTMDLEIGHLDTLDWNGIEFANTNLSIPGEEPILWFERLRLEWGWTPQYQWQMFCLVEDPMIVLANNQDDVLNWNRMFPSTETSEPTTSTWPSLGLNIAVPILEVQGGKIDAFGQILDWHLDMGLFWNAEDQVEWRLHDIGVFVEEIGPIQSHSQIAGDGEQLQVSLDLMHESVTVKLEGEIDRIVSVPSVDFTLRSVIHPSLMTLVNTETTLLSDIVIDATIEGDIANLRADVQSNLGLELSSELELDTEEWSGTLNIAQFSVQQWIGNVEPTDIQGQFAFQGTGLVWPGTIKGTLQGQLQEGRLWNEPIQHLNLDLAVHTGMVTVKTLDVQHPAGKISLGGSLDSVGAVADLVLNTQIDDISSWVDSYGVSVKGKHQVMAKWSDAVQVDVEGAMQLQNLTDGQGVSISSGSIDTKGSWKEGQLQLQNTLVATGVEAVGVQMPSMTAEIVVEQSDTTGLRISGTPVLPYIEVGEGTLSLADVTGGFQYVQQAEQSTLQTEAMTVGAVTLVPAQYVIDGGNIALKLDNDNLIADLHLLRKEKTFIQTRAKAALADGIWSIDRLNLSPTGDQEWSLKEGVSFVLTEGGVENLNLDLVGDAGDIHITVDQHNAIPDIGLEIEGLDLQYVREMTNLFIGPDTIPMPITGEAFGTIHLLGEEGHFQEDDFLWFESVSSPDLISETDIYVDLKGSLSQINSHLKVQHGDSNLLQVFVQAPLVDGVPNCQRPLYVEGSVMEDNWERLHTWIPVIPNLDLTANADFHVYGTFCEPILQLFMQGDTALGSQQERVRWEVDATHKDDALIGQIQVFDGVYERIRIEIEGNTNLSKQLSGDTTEPFQEIRLQGASKALYMQRIGSLIGVPDFGKGKVDLTFDVHVHPEEIGGTLDIELPKVRLAKHRLSEQSGLHLVFEQQQLTGTMLIDFLNKGSIVGDVSYDLASDGIFSTIDIEQVPATLLSTFITDIRNEHGKIEGNILLDGTLKEPLVNALLQIQELGFQLPSLGTEYRNIDLEASMENGKLSISKLEGDAKYIQSGPIELDSWGKFAVRSTASYSDDGLRATARLGLDKFPLLNTDMMRGSISGSVEMIQGAEMLSFSGDAYVHEATVRLGRDFFEEGASLTLPSSFRIHRNVQAVKQKDAVDDWLEDWLKTVRGDLQVDLGDRVVIQTTMPMTNDYGEGVSKLSEVRVDTVLRGVLDVGWRSGEPTVLGTVSTIRGSFVTMGKEFELGEGDIVFSGADVYNPQLNLYAQKGFGEYGTVGVSVTGAVDVMELNFEAIDSPYPYDQTDIVTLLLLGKPSQDLANAESQTAATLIQAGLTSMSGAVGDAFGGTVVDNLDWDPTEGMFRVGKTLSDTMFLSYMHNYWAEEGENINELTLEWLVLQRIYGEMVTGDANNTQATLYYRWIF